MANGILGTTSTDTADTSETGTELPPLSLELDTGGLFSSNPVLQVAGDTDTVLTGDDDADILIGGAGNDDLTGNDGDDVLIGGGGRNILEGGGGEDTFGHSAGAFDIIVDFDPEEEELALAEGVTVTDSEQGTVEAELGTGSTTHAAEILTLSDGSTIALIGVTQAFSTDWLVGSESA
jgi:Ca2+-binding RTX toxin-like protein